MDCNLHIRDLDSQIFFYFMLDWNIFFNICKNDAFKDINQIINFEQIIDL